MSLKISFSRPIKFKIFSWLIRKIDRSEFSHVSISWYSEFLEREIVYQASSVMVNFCEGKRFREQHKIIEEIELDMSEDTRKRVIQYAMDRAGVPYGILQCVGIAWVKLCAALGKNVRNPFSNGRTLYVCCELAADLLESEFGFKFSESLDNLTPRDLLQILSNVKSV